MEGAGRIRCWPKYLWKWVKFMRLKAKGTVYKTCIAVDKIISYGNTS